MIQISCCNFKESVYIFATNPPSTMSVMELNLSITLDWTSDFRTLISIQILSTCLIIRVLPEDKLCRSCLGLGFFTNLVWKTIPIAINGSLPLPLGFHSCFLAVVLWWETVSGLLSCLLHLAMVSLTSQSYQEQY